MHTSSDARSEGHASPHLEPAHGSLRGQTTGAWLLDHSPGIEADGRGAEVAGERSFSRRRRGVARRPSSARVDGDGRLSSYGEDGRAAAGVHVPDADSQRRFVGARGDGEETLGSATRRRRTRGRTTAEPSGAAGAVVGGGAAGMQIEELDP